MGSSTASSRRRIEKLQETDRKPKEVLNSLVRLGNRLGDFVEEMVKPALLALFQERGMPVYASHHDVTVERYGETIEIDFLVWTRMSQGIPNPNRPTIA